MSFNVENLFDEVENGSEYPEYRGGAWNRELFEAKCRALAEVIKKASRRGPDIIALQEVENRNALLNLRDRHLAGLGYRYAVIASREGAANGPAVLSRFPILRSHSLGTGLWKEKPLRPILEVVFEFGGGRLHLFNNHWKSKSEGADVTEEARLKEALVLRERILEILDRDPKADILVLGDLNENIEEYLEVGGKYRTALICAEASGEEDDLLSGIILSDLPGQAGLKSDRLSLYEPWYEIPEERRGSYVYRGRWQTPDHILLSEGLFSGRGFEYEPGGFRPMREPFLLDEKTGFPKRWYYKGGQAPGGYSDHLPLLITLKLSAD